MLRSLVLPLQQARKICVPFLYSTVEFQLEDQGGKVNAFPMLLLAKLLDARANFEVAQAMNSSVAHR